MKRISQLSLFLFLLFSITTIAQNSVWVLPKKTTLSDAELKRWSHLDLEQDSIPGMSVDRAYTEVIKDKMGEKVIVAIIDSGVDINHEDLKTVIWTNPKEIAGNGKDDDKNNYIDDVHGWNYLGNIVKEDSEAVRIIKDKSIIDEETYNRAKTEIDKKVAEAEEKVFQMEQMQRALLFSDDVLSNHLGKKDYTLAEVQAIVSEDPKVLNSKQLMEHFFSFGVPIDMVKEEIDKELKKYQAFQSGDYLKKDYRKVLGDDPNNIKDTNYGNAIVTGPEVKETLHGTHVSGIVGMVRGNNIGGDGIANNVSIMVLRAVPDGDEYDKDIALAIRYAVDNGAKVINASFGKGYSPHKDWVYDAIEYAAKKDVLIVHAAGNDAKDIDIERNYPNDSEDLKTEFADNMITVGALNFDYGKMVVAEFSNYGKENVDVFAPGVQIFSTTPNDSYQYLEGTSMASPNVAGVAALVRSYYPKLKANQVKHILMNSGTKIDFGVTIGEGGKTQKLFADLSKSGTMVNAYKALIMAGQVSKGKKSGKSVF